MVDVVKSDENVEYKKVETKKDETFTWQGVCPICGEQSVMGSFKELDFLISPCRYIYAKCGHRFLVDKR